VSDTAAQDNSVDQSGPTVRQILSDRNVVVGEKDHIIVRDDVEAIRRVVRDWTGREGDLRIDWIITTGGTGFGVRDVTPEVRTSAHFIVEKWTLIRAL
jgi:gephyrin